GQHNWLERAPKSGGAAEALVNFGSNSVSGIVSRFLADGSFIYAADFGMIRRFAKSNGAEVELYDITNPANPTFGDRMSGFALDDGAVYWSSSPNDAPDLVAEHSWLARVNKDGSGARSIFDSSSVIAQLVVWGDSVYFGWKGALYRVCKQ